MGDKDSSGFPEKGTEDTKKVFEWLHAVIQRKLLLGGRMTESVYTELMDDLDQGRLDLSQILGWCVEILQAGILVEDDITETGIKAKGQFCWYNHQRNIPFSGARLLEHSSLQILRVQFVNNPVYSFLLDKFLRASFTSLLEQNMYNSIGIFRISYYTIFLPLALAMLLEGIPPRGGSSEENQQLWKDVESVTLNIVSFLEYSESAVTNNNNGSVVHFDEMLPTRQHHHLHICDECVRKYCYESVMNSIEVINHGGLRNILYVLVDNIYYRDYC